MTNSLLLKIAHLELFYLLKIVIFHSYVSVPEGMHVYMIVYIFKKYHKYHLSFAIYLSYINPHFI